MPVAFSSPEVESDACPGSGRLAEFLQTAERRRPQLLRMARRLTQNSEDAEDVVQEAFLKAFKALAQFRGEAQMSSWLGTIVQNTAHEHLRSRRNRVFVSIECHDKDENDTFELGLPDPRKNPEETWARTEMDAILRSEINKLSLVCRRAIELCVLEEHSQLTAASALNLTTATMKSRVFRGKRILGRTVSRRLAARHGAMTMAADHRVSCEI
jgi:RNA polymerase sigma-70 factor (ECF subfamily)